MHQKNNPTYQLMIRHVRLRNIRGFYGWPGKSVNASAVTRYPNILAEMAASHKWLYLLAEFSGVSPEIMAAVLEDGEEMSSIEMRGLARYLRVNIGYLAAPELSMIDSASNKGRARLHQLRDLIKQADGLKIDFMRSIEQTRDAMEHGELVTYASWRWCCQEIEDARERQWSAGRKRLTIRAERRVVV